LFILESGSLAVFVEVSLDFIPRILRQKEERRFALFPFGFFSVTAV
jgi:hypothetical protein